MPASDLSVFFRPHGVAVIGASRSRSSGYGVVRNLQNCPLRRGRSTRSIRNEDGDPRLPGLSTASRTCRPGRASGDSGPGANCGRTGRSVREARIKGAIIVSGGFRETGGALEGRRPASSEVKRIAAQLRVRLLGPNCIGTIDTHTPLNTTFMVSMPRPGDIAFVSQSGAMAAAVMDWAAGSG